jgi:hypothetical protein
MGKTKKLIAVLGILLIIINIVAFLVPFPKTAVFWISDIFVIFAVIAQYFVEKIAYGHAETIKSKFYGFPVLRVGMLYLGSIIGCAVVFILLSCVIWAVPIWLPVVVYVVATGLFAIGLITTDSVRNFVETQDRTQQANTSFMRKMTAEALALEKGNTDPKIQKILERLYDDIRASDPVSSEALAGYETELERLFRMIQEAALHNDSDKVMDVYKEFYQQLTMRNAACRSMKN